MLEYKLANNYFKCAGVLPKNIKHMAPEYA